MWWRNYSQILFKKIKVEHVYGSFKVLYSLFLLYAKLYAIKVIETKLKITSFTSYTAFLKTKFAFDPSLYIRSLGPKYFFKTIEGYQSSISK